jgi:hypothetical protein
MKFFRMLLAARKPIRTAVVLVLATLELVTIWCS